MTDTRPWWVLVVAWLVMAATILIMGGEITHSLIAVVGSMVMLDIAINAERSVNK
jgi:uncharacterized membrane protein YjjP (DUF1212 family)